MFEYFVKFLSLFSIISLSACQTGPNSSPTLGARISQAESLDKAKKVTAKFKTGFVLLRRACGHGYDIVVE